MILHVAAAIAIKAEHVLERESPVATKVHGDADLKLAVRPALRALDGKAPPAIGLADLRLDDVDALRAEGAVVKDDAFHETLRQHVGDHSDVFRRATRRVREDEVHQVDVKHPMVRSARLRIKGVRVTHTQGQHSAALWYASRRPRVQCTMVEAGPAQRTSWHVREAMTIELAEAILAKVVVERAGQRLRPFFNVAKAYGARWHVVVLCVGYHSDDALR